MTLEDYISFVGYPDYEMFFDRIQELRVTDDEDLSDSVLVGELTSPRKGVGLPLKSSPD